MLCCVDWQVFLFCANDKGASWAYSTPGFGASLAPAHLKLLRQMANPDVDDASKVPHCNAFRQKGMCPLQRPAAGFMITNTSAQAGLQVGAAGEV